MYTVSVENVEDWRKKAKALVVADISPDQVVWTTKEQPSLFAPPTLEKGGEVILKVPPRFAELTRTVACHSDPTRWSILYSLLFRICKGERTLLEDKADPTVREASRFEQQVNRDIHRIYAFLRFLPIQEEGREVYVAYYEPEHEILEIALPFFVRRFRNMEWRIITPYRSAWWDKEKITYLPGEKRKDSTGDDEFIAAWQDYYGASFNPARVNLRKLKSDIPSRFWFEMPELAKVSTLVQEAPMRVQKMKENQVSDASSLIPHHPSYQALREAAAKCTACPLYQNATQTVFGEGPKNPEIMLVGEQPGDEEDVKGEPFVGPAGRLLDKALVEAGIDRDTTYVTNAVKHFKWIPRGKRRIHQKPSGGEISACRPWLEHEIKILKPRLIICLGATAAQSVLARAVKVLSERGDFFPGPNGSTIAVTVHPSSILRTTGSEEREKALQALIEDLRGAYTHLRSTPSV